MVGVFFVFIVILVIFLVAAAGSDGFSVAKSMVYGEIRKGSANGGMSAQPGKWLRKLGSD
jgi:hypothetical protein